jgi:tripartite-type tricarboxylate transporter receptor subunit TctC
MMDAMRRGAGILLVLPALLCAAAPGAAADKPQSWPVKPLRMVVPFPAGASSDIVGRLLAEKLSQQLGEQVVPDNRPGAGSNLGLAFAAKAPADGYTIVIATASIAIGPSIYAKLGYDPIKDLAPVARLTSIPNIMLVHPSVPVKTLKQFVELARARPGKLNYGSGGVGTTNHLANELLKHLEMIDIVHVPYKGVTQAMLAMIGGEVDEVVMPVATSLPHIHSGRVRPLAVLSDERIAVAPDVPTSAEAGVPGFTIPLWYAMFAPAGTPAEIVARLNRELTKILETAEVREKLSAQGVDPWAGTPEQLRELLRADIERFGHVARAAGLPRQ